MRTYRIRFPWRTIQATTSSRWRAYWEIVKHELLELTRGSAYAHSTPSAIRYSVGELSSAPNLAGLRGENFPVHIDPDNGAVTVSFPHSSGVDSLYLDGSIVQIIRQDDSGTPTSTITLTDATVAVDTSGIFQLNGNPVATTDML